MGGSVFSRLGYVFAHSAFKNLRQRMDPNAANGGMFLGLNGMVVKSHGGADAGVCLGCQRGNRRGRCGHLKNHCGRYRRYNVLDDAEANIG